MREKSKAGGHESPYRLRKQLPERVFGQIKQARGFCQFLLRGIEKVATECGLVCLAHNVLNLAQGRALSVAVLAASFTPTKWRYAWRVEPVPNLLQGRRHRIKS
jgi:hypothetical protein